MTTMPVITLDHPTDFAQSMLNSSTTLYVACLCAQWCSACGEYRQTFETLARAYPEVCFLWIDIETHADWLDTFDIENFPTLLIEKNHTTYFFGPILPQTHIVKKLLTLVEDLPPLEEAPKLADI